MPPSDLTPIVPALPVHPLAGNALAVPYAGDDASAGERLGRVLALIPALFGVVEEARDTIERLRAEVTRLSTDNAPALGTKAVSGAGVLRGEEKGEGNNGVVGVESA